MAFYKFLDSEKAVDSFCSGKMWFRTPQYYRTCEEKEISGRKDENDGMIALENFVAPIKFVMKSATENSAIMCVSHNLKKSNFERMKKMGDYVVVIENEQLFEDKIRKEAIYKGYTLKARDAFYYQDLDKNVIDCLTKGLENFMFMKHQNFGYQQEYRFLLHKEKLELDDDDIIELDIGNIMEICKIMSVEKLSHTL